MAEDRPEHTAEFPDGELPDSGRVKRAPPTIDLEATEVSDRTHEVEGEPLTTAELQGMQGILGIRDGVLKTSGKTNPSALDFVAERAQRLHDRLAGAQ